MPFQPDAVDEVGHDGDVDDEQGDPDQGGATEDFIELEGDEGAGRDDREPLRPWLEKPQAEALGEEESSVKKRADAELPDLPRWNVRQP